MKTSLAPGSRVVMDYLERAALTGPLEELGFYLVGYGCTTCIGNSGPLLEGVSEAVHEGDLAVSAVLSGNRNFEGRIHPDVRLNYLASPPLVVAYALAGTMDLDLTTEPLGQDADRHRRVPLRPVAVDGGGERDHPGLADVGHVPRPATPRSSTATSTGRTCRWPAARPTRGRTRRPTCRTRPTSPAWR